MQTQPPHRVAALMGVMTPVLFTTLVVVQEFLSPGYSPIAMPASALAAWPTGWLQNVNCYASGSLTIAFAAALHRALKPTPVGSVGIGLFGLGGVGIVIAGLFPWSRVDGKFIEPPAHLAAAVLIFFGTALGLILFSRWMRRHPAWRAYSSYTLWSGLGMLALSVTIGAFAKDEGTPLHGWFGLIQRLLGAVWFVWIVRIALRLRTLGRAAHLERSEDLSRAV